ncbi:MULTISPECIES: Hsp20/alpha crystallin family protein [unclassified Saccharopolyspora]|uniref:Hsp20/alpha crystallin family protein n=1 Tax=unclassified Saccharopolyspora TaxID=2646250 RepID=UPI001CD53269|nr:MULTISPECIES: Hsp20 family protein [unclassified Saccharopolyspora]MCA1187831.1 Hsp20 family protein [Saccharopolyspora sp. 6T]MCA1227014.1 Hsp20 family protein [Saccharopolyspora sp. 6M]MCA1281756.1 Hsp20 family protein [Saccharopolyspora sp. 7B]
MALAVRGWDQFAGLDREFDALVRGAFRGRGGAEQRYAPAADVLREGSDLVFRLDLPGVDVEDVSVEVADGALKISGSRTARTEVPAEDADGSGPSRVLVRELRSGAFSRGFRLPKGVTGEQVEADYDRGVLEVRVRGALEQAAPTKVAVRDRAAKEVGVPAEDR